MFVAGRGVSRDILRFVHTRTYTILYVANIALDVHECVVSCHLSAQVLFATGHNTRMTKL